MRIASSPTVLLMLAIAAASGCASAQGSASLQTPVKSKVFDLGPLQIEGTYKSMNGPWAAAPFDSSDMDWIVGFGAEVDDAQSGRKLSDEFFCHSQIQLDNDTPLVVTAMGIPRVRFPQGFGIPLKRVLASMPPDSRGAHLFGMVLNNHDPDLKRSVKVRLTIDYLSDPTLELKKLYKQGLTMTVEPDAAGGGSAEHGPGCAMVNGRSEHWFVPPGRQVTHRKFTGIVPMDATVHYAVAHLHNYGRSIRLTDLTTGKVVWETAPVYEKGRVQIQEIPTYSSAAGFPVYRDHEYQLDAVYDNTTSAPVDAMAMMYLFWHPPGNEDLSYDAPTVPSPPAERSSR